MECARIMSRFDPQERICLGATASYSQARTHEARRPLTCATELSLLRGSSRALAETLRDIASFYPKSGRPPRREGKLLANEDEERKALRKARCERS
jgi:hypothetical protein